MARPLISADELAERIDQVTVLDVRYRMGGPPGADEYAAGHLPGAVYVDLDTDLAASVDERPDEGRHPLPDPAAFQAAMRRAGVSGERPVVVYDDWQGRAAARAWWLLRWAGHDDVRVLDGGWGAWLERGYPTSTEPVVPVEGDLVVVPGSMATVGYAGVREWDGVLVDARAPERYLGRVEPVDPVAGHVPGAVNVPTETNLGAEGRFRPAGQLAALYAAEGVDGSQPVAVYCGSGVTACHDVLALAAIGVDATLFAPSWSGWVSDPERPVATGRE